MQVLGQQDSPCGTGNNADKHLITLKANFLNPFAMVSKQTLKQLIARSHNQLPAIPTSDRSTFLRFQGKKKKGWITRGQIAPRWSLISSGIFKETRKLFSWQEPKLAAGRGDHRRGAGRGAPSLLCPPRVSALFGHHLPKHIYVTLPTPLEVVLLLEGAQLRLATSSCDAECQSRWKPTGEQWRQNLAS